MFWFGLLLSVVAALIVLPNLIGLFLPERFIGSAQREFPQPPERVWTTLEDFRQNPLSGAMCRSVDPLGGAADRPDWRENLSGTRLLVRTIEAEHARRLVRDAADEVVPMTSRWTYDLTPTATGGTRVTLALDGRIKHGTWHVPFFRFMMHVMGGRNSSARAHLAHIARSLDAA